MAIVTILTASSTSGAPDAAEAPGTAPVFRCDFDSAWDANYDGWPDGWTRASGPGYPKYVTIELAPPAGKVPACLRVALDGGGAIAYSPLTRARPDGAYRLEVDVQCEGLVRNHVWVSLNFYDADRRPLGAQRSRRLGGTTPWTTLAIDSAAPPQAGVRYVGVGLHVEPQGRPDVRGGARFRRVRVTRTPRLELDALPTATVFAAPQPIEFRGRASGYASRGTALRFRLTDCQGRVVDELRQPLPPVAGDWLSLATAPAPQTSWPTRLPDFGFYRASVALEEQGRVLAERGLSLAVVPAAESRGGSDFGWSLRDVPPLPAEALADLVAQSGLGWIKLPMWLDEDDPALAERIELIEAVAARGVRTIGVLDRPPASVAAAIRPAGALPLAQVLAADPDSWRPSLEGMLARLGLRVRHWQLGADGDEGLLGDPQLGEKLREIRQLFEQMGHGEGLGLGWNWLYPLPTEARGGFASLSADPELTTDELQASLEAAPHQGPARWVLLRALQRHEHPPEVRAADLVRQMIAAKAGQADAVFLDQPLDDERGLLSDDGTPGELFVPWRTAALVLGGSKPLGQIELPLRSANQVFLRGDEAAIAVWADTPRIETLHAGPAARAVDLWGRAREIARDESGGWRLPVGPEPCFVTGVAGPLVQWQLAAELEPRRLPVRLGSAQTLRLTLRNPLSRPASGQLRLVPPDRWRVAPERLAFKLAAGAAQVESLEVALPYHAAVGPQTMRLEFELTADRSYAFCVQREIVVGDDDLELAVTTRLNAAGELEVEQRLANAGAEPLSFRCELFVKGRKRQQSAVLDREQGEDVQLYRLRDGRALIGETIWLRAEEIGGTRVLNAQVVAEP